MTFVHVPSALFSSLFSSLVSIAKGVKYFPPNFKEDLQAMVLKASEAPNVQDLIAKSKKGNPALWLYTKQDKKASSPSRSASAKSSP